MLGKLFSGGKDSAANQAKLKEQWKRGLGYLEGRLINRAVKELSDAMKQDPAYIEEGVELVREYATHGEDESAAHIGMAVLKFRPHDKDLCYQLAETMRRLKSFKNASKLFERTLQIDPTSMGARIGHAACSFRITTDEGLLSSQIRILQRAKELRRFEFQGNHKNILLVSNTSITDEDYEREKILKKLPQLEDITADGLEGIERALKADAEKDINQWQAQFNLGLYYDLTGNTDQALQYLALACKLAPKEAAAVNNLACMLMEHKKDYTRGESLLLMFLQHSPHNRTTVLNLMLCYKLQKKSSHALRYSVYLAELLIRSLGRFSLDHALKQALLYITQRKYREALPLVQHLVDEIPSVEMLGNLAKVYLSLRREADHVATIDRMHQAFPTNQEVITQINDLCAEYDKKAHESATHKDWRQATECMSHAIKLVETFERHKLLADWFSQNRQPQHAQLHLKRIKEIEAAAEETTPAPKPATATEQPPAPVPNRPPPII